MNILIRSATLADAPAVQTLAGQLGYPIDSQTLSERLAAILDDPGQTLLVAEIDSLVCGWVYLLAGPDLLLGFDADPAMQKVYGLYKLFYAVLAAMVLSGLALYWKLAGNAKEGIETVHMVMGWSLFAFMAIHIVGVVLAEKGAMKGLVSRLISGRE